MLIGLTGTYCTGKNYVASLLEVRGLQVLDVDKLGYQALETEKDALFAQFGQDLQRADGSVDRRLLGRRVFGKPEKLSALEAFVHPIANRLSEDWVLQKAKKLFGPKLSDKEVLQLIINSKTCHFVINAALLHRSTLINKLNCIILVKAPLITRILRAKKRDKLSWKEIFRRFNSQKNFYSQYLSKNAEIYNVENSGFFKSQTLQKKLENQINKILEGF